MNKTESVSIGRRAFVCEVDAYTVIKAYLEKAKKRLVHDPDREEILSDLEHAMAGHLIELCGTLVVDKASAEKVVSMLGEVETDAADKADVIDSAEEETSFTERLGLLFKKVPQKDRSRAIVEGVCAGIAKLLMIDPFWVRLAFIVFTVLSQGFGILIYIILALVMQDEDEYVGKTAGEVVGAVKERAKVGFEQGAKRYELVLARIIRKTFRVIMVAADIVLLLVLIGLGALWSTMLFFMITNPNRVVLFGQQPTVLDFMALVSVGAVILIPVLLLIMQLAGARLVRNVRANVIFGCLWVLSLLLAAGSAINVVPNVHDRLVRDSPMTKNVVVEVAGDQIVHSCFTLWGDCRSDRPQIFTTSVCGSDVQMVDPSDMELTHMQNWSWRMQSDTLSYPMSEQIYCDFVRTTLSRHDPGRVVFAAQAWNDDDYVQDTAYADTVCPNGQPNTSASSASESSGRTVESGNMMNARERGLSESGTNSCLQSAPKKVWVAQYYTR